MLYNIYIEMYFAFSENKHPILNVLQFSQYQLISYLINFTITLIEIDMPNVILEFRNLNKLMYFW